MASKETAKKTARQAAFTALLNWHQKGTFLWDSLEKWKIEENPKKSDLDFAYELACGSLRKQRYLDHIIKIVVKKKPAKEKECIILRLALYQCYFLPNIPIYAIANTMVQIAKKQCHSSFASFLNALLRKLQLDSLPTPQTTDIGIIHSYPDSFVQLLLQQYGPEKTVELLERGNKPTPLTGCLYKEATLMEEKALDDPILTRAGLKMFFMDSPNPLFYIQNRTQPKLLANLAEGISYRPKRILDMCAAPGGKSLILHHFYPEATLVVNDSAENKIARLSENLHRFSCPAQILCQKGEELQSDVRFDLILIDAPCSNSGVLYKCPEARWRISEESLASLAKTQAKLIANAMNLLDKDGKIWFMTCSILAQENERQILEVCKYFNLKIDGNTFLQLPDNEGHEGGFACQLSLQKNG